MGIHSERFRHCALAAGLLSEGKKRTELLAQAVAAFRSALEVYTRKQFPQQWVLTQNGLSDTLGALSNQFRGRGRPETQARSGGIASECDVLSIRRSVTLQVGICAWRSRLQSGLKSPVCRGPDTVRKAQRLTNEIGDGVQKRDRDSLIFIQGNLAHALLFQGHYDEALIIYREK